MRRNKIVWSSILALVLLLSAATGLDVEAEPESVTEAAPREAAPEPTSHDPAPVPACERALLSETLKRVTDKAEVPTGLPVEDLVGAVSEDEVCEVVELLLDLVFCDHDEECVDLLAWLLELVDRVLEDARAVVDRLLTHVPDGLPASGDDLTRTLTENVQVVPAESSTVSAPSVLTVLTTVEEAGPPVEYVPMAAPADVTHPAGEVLSAHAPSAAQVSPSVSPSTDPLSL